MRGIDNFQNNSTNIKEFKNRKSEIKQKNYGIIFGDNLSNNSLNFSKIYQISKNLCPKAANPTFNNKNTPQYQKQ